MCIFIDRFIIDLSGDNLWLDVFFSFSCKKQYFGGNTIELFRYKISFISTFLVKEFLSN
jgi:hypothetical protein